jgi:hypothetical protein
MIRNRPAKSLFSRDQLGALAMLLTLGAALPAQTPPKPETPAPAPVPETPDTEGEIAPPVLTVTDKWTVLVNPVRPRAGVVSISPKAPIRNLEKFEFQGPQTGHPFCLGDYVEDGQFSMVNGAATVVEGKNALLSLGVAHDFELEGILDLDGLGGWLMLLGWHAGHGYSLSNVTLKDSGSPWFVCEYRGNEAIVPTNNEIRQLAWTGAKPFRMGVKEGQLTVQVDKVFVVENYPLENYSAGELMIGTYDTRYGPRPLKIQSLRIRSPSVPKPKEK